MKLFRSVILLCLAASAALCSAQTTRVAYVDIDRVTAKSKQVNDAMGRVEGKVKGIQEEMAAKTRLLAETKLEVKRGEGVLAESELKKKRDAATKLENDVAELDLKSRREMQVLDKTFFEPMLKTIVFAIQDVAKEKKIDLVVRGEAVIYGAPASDITEAVITKLNSGAYANAGSGSNDSSTSASDDDASPADKPAPAADTTEEPSAEEPKQDMLPTTTPAPPAARSEAAPKATPAATRAANRPAGTRPVDRMKD